MVFPQTAKPVRVENLKIAFVWTGRRKAYGVPPERMAYIECRVLGLNNVILPSPGRESG